MKRDKIIKYITQNGCLFDREGSNHTIYFNPKISKSSAVPRHSEIDDKLCNRICKQLGIPQIK